MSWGFKIEYNLGNQKGVGVSPVSLGEYWQAVRSGKPADKW